MWERPGGSWYSENSSGVLSPCLMGLELWKESGSFPALSPRKEEPSRSCQCWEDPEVLPWAWQSCVCSTALCLFGVSPNEAKLECLWVQCWCHSPVTCPGTKAATAEDCPPARDGQRISWASSLLFGSRCAGRHSCWWGCCPGTPSPPFCLIPCDLGFEVPLT